MSLKGLLELSAIVEDSQLLAVFCTAQLSGKASSALKSHRSAHFAQIGEEIALQVRADAVAAKERLDSLQKELIESSIGSEQLRFQIPKRDDDRKRFIGAANSLRDAFATGSPLDNHIRRLLESQLQPEPEPQLEPEAGHRQPKQMTQEKIDQLEVQRRLGRKDQAMAEGTRLWVDGCGDGVYVRCAKSWFGANEHHVRFGREVKTLNLQTMGSSQWKVTGLADWEQEPEPEPEQDQDSKRQVPLQVERAAWERAQAHARQLAAFADDCQRIIDTSEPDRSIAALVKLQGQDEALHQKLQLCRNKIEALELNQGSPIKGSSHDLSRAASTPEQRAKKNALLGQPMEEWSESQVQEWFAVIGLTSADVEVVQQALASARPPIDGEELEGFTKSRLRKLLVSIKVPAERASDLARQTLELHEAAHRETSASGKLATLKAELRNIRDDLRENSKQIRLEVKDMYVLASEHFPELRGRREVKDFISSGGLQLSNRKLVDYDVIGKLSPGRFEVLHVRYGGSDLCLKKFPLKGDIGGYLREIRTVQQLQHPNIIHYNAVFQDGDSMYIEMEYCKHGNLIQWMKKQQPGKAQKQSVLRQILLALACTCVCVCVCVCVRTNCLVQA